MSLWALVFWEEEEEEARASMWLKDPGHRASEAVAQAGRAHLLPQSWEEPGRGMVPPPGGVSIPRGPTVPIEAPV